MYRIVKGNSYSGGSIDQAELLVEGAHGIEDQAGIGITFILS